MRMHLLANGVWKLHSCTEGIKCYDDLPQKAKNILNLVLVMAPYDTVKYYAYKEDFHEETLRTYKTVNDTLGQLYPFHPINCRVRYDACKLFNPDRLQYEVEITTKLIKKWKVEEQDE